MKLVLVITSFLFVFFNTAPAQAETCGKYIYTPTKTILDTAGSEHFVSQECHDGFLVTTDKSCGARDCHCQIILKNQSGKEIVIPTNGCSIEITGKNTFLIHDSSDFSFIENKNMGEDNSPKFPLIICKDRTGFFVDCTRRDEALLKQIAEETFTILSKIQDREGQNKNFKSAMITLFIIDSYNSTILDDQKYNPHKAIFKEKWFQPYKRRIQHSLKNRTGRAINLN